MGMYDCVSVPDIDCPKCGKPLSDWQSKSGDCVLDEIHYSAVDNFYTSCDECHAWIEFTKRVYPDAPLSSYEMTDDAVDSVLELQEP